MCRAQDGKSSLVQFFATAQRSLVLISGTHVVVMDISKSTHACLGPLWVPKDHSLKKTYQHLWSNLKGTRGSFYSNVYWVLHTQSYMNIISIHVLVYSLEISFVIFQRFEPFQPRSNSCVIPLVRTWSTQPWAAWYISVRTAMLFASIRTLLHDLILCYIHIYVDMNYRIL